MAYQFQKLKVLIVEDNKPMAILLKSVLLSLGVGTVISALNGEEGFAQFCKYNPDIVIADWMMSPGDGITLSKQIRNDPASPNQFVPIILMTGFSEKRRAINARDAGITEFLVKPFNTRDLYKRFYKIIETPRDFVRSEDFFGPDRRRTKPDTEYNGKRRRKADFENGEQQGISVIEVDLM